MNDSLSKVPGPAHIPRRKVSCRFAFPQAVRPIVTHGTIKNIFVVKRISAIEEKTSETFTIDAKLIGTDSLDC